MAFKVLPRPVVLVHGLKSNAQSWEQWYKPGGFLCTHGFPSNAEYEQGGEAGPWPWAEAWCGFPVNTMDTSSPTSKSIEQNAQALSDYVEEVMNATGSDRVDLVGHSMGGLISRWYISTIMHPDEPPPGDLSDTVQHVSRLIMLGTPNMGSHAALEGGILRALAFGALNRFVPQPATAQNTPQFVNGTINQVASDRKGVHFFAVGGSIDRGSLGSPCVSLDGYPSDLVVSRKSTKWILGGDEYLDMKTTHVGQLSCKEATDGAEQQSVNDFNKALAVLRDSSKARPEATNARTSMARNERLADASTADPSPVTAARGAILKPGQSVTVQTRSAPGAPDLNALVGVDPTAIRPELTLRAPDGKVSTPPRLQQGVIFQDVSAAGGDVPPVIALSVRDPKPGTWTLTATNPLTSKQKALVAVPMFTTDDPTGPSLASQAARSVYGAGQLVTVTARVLQARGATAVNAVVQSRDDPSSAPQQIALYDDGKHGDGRAGDGVYGATFPAATRPGAYEVAVTLISGGYQRFDVTEFSVTPLVVRTTADSSTCPSIPDTQSPLTLRCAIQQADQDNGVDTILFAIPSSDTGCARGQCTIAPAATFPPITSDNTTVDGYSQPEASPNTLSQGDNARIAIHLDGAHTAGTANGLTIKAGGVEVKGLEITRFTGNAITVSAPDVVPETGIVPGVIDGNFLGTDGTAAFGNGGCGIAVLTENVLVGGSTPGARNVSSGNTQAGACIASDDNSSVGADHNSIEGNYLGTNAAGTATIPNHEGVSISFASTNTIGGIGSGSGNLISGNRTNGVTLDGDHNLLEGNLIGTDVRGTAALPNGQNGVAMIDYGNTNTVGGTSPGSGNVISGNGADGIAMLKDQCTYCNGNIVEGNYLGVDARGLAALPNRGNGVEISGKAQHNLIGGSKPGSGNVISANMASGVDIAGAGSNIVQGNRIGIDRSGVHALGNHADGISLHDGTTAALIGGTDQGSGNLVAHNAEDGVLVGWSAKDSTTVHNAITRNSIYANGMLGIDLAPQNVVNCTAAGSGPNDYTPCPVITTATVHAVSGTACPTCTVELYVAAAGRSDQGHGEGESFMRDVTADGRGNWSITGLSLGVGESVTATATTSGSNAETSEFAANAVVRG